MAFETPPGQLLSNVPSSSSDKRRRSKLGGCAGVLFQIFHAKRWLPRKSLPAERVTQATSNYTDDKLPIAKLLLIAEENRIGSLRDGDEVCEDEIVDKTELHEEKGSRRKLGVVARLMGLESMPFSKVPPVEGKQAEMYKNSDQKIFTDSLREDRDSSSTLAIPQHFSSQMAKRRGSTADLSAKIATSPMEKVPESSGKWEAFPRIRSSSCHHKDTSFPSSVKGHSSNKKSMSTKKPAHRIEVAPTLLKKNQQNHQSGSHRFEGSFSGGKRSLHANHQFTNSAAAVSCNKQDEVKLVKPVPYPASNERRQSVGLQKLQSAQEHLNKRSLQETSQAKRRHSYQRAIEQPKSLSNEKSRPELRQQDEFSKRISQPTVCSMKKSQGAKASRHLSPPKSFQDSSGGACSSQASNCVTLSSEGTVPSQLIKSHVGSNNVTVRKHSSLSLRGSLSKHKHTDGFDDVTKPSPMCQTVADLAHRDMKIINSFDASHSNESGNNFYSQFDHDGSTSSAIYTESLQRSSLESSISSDPSLSEYATTSEECSNLSSGENLVEHDRDEENQKADLKRLDDIERASGFSLMESSIESLCESLTTGSTAEILSSHHEPEVNAYNADAVCTHSGKNTAALLQELLTALSTSTSQKKLDYNEKPEGTVPYTLDSEIRKPLGLSNVNVECVDNLSSESIVQDSAFTTSSDSAQPSQENEQCEIDSLKKDCAVTNELQSKSGLSRDCEALMTAISKLHQIDPGVIGLKARLVNDSISEGVPLDFNSRGAVSGCLPNSDCSGKPEEQTQGLDCGPLSSTTLTAEGDADSSICKSDIESNFRTGDDEIAVWNKKLVTDCIDEAFKSLSKQIYKFSSSLSEPPSATHLLSRVYMQLDEWRGMAINMNLDEMIEKEMNITTREWRHIGKETEEVAEFVQTTVFSGLLEEVLLELM